MKQVIQNFKSGELFVDEVPAPVVATGMVLVENQFSLISAGTERSTVSVGQASLFGKAKLRPDLVKQVIQNIRKEGLLATISKVRTKLDSLKALGYSTAGTVLSSLDTNGTFKPGDRVACAGQDYASHAEIVAIPQNLVARIPDNVSYEEASFTTLGAIALQGVRQALPTIGETVCVIGLGLLGQLTCQLLQANGCRVFGIDIAQSMVDLAAKTGAATAFKSGSENMQSAISHFTNGQGFDAVIITAAAPTNEPIELAAEILRRKGRVIIVGAVKMDVPRDPHFYRKELELRMSCSYGPGRYDPEYEEKGHDYPFGYVRWTEQRNMEAFLQLVAQGRLNLKPLITHTFAIDDAEKAYDIVLGKMKEPFLGILLHYPERAAKFAPSITLNTHAGAVTKEIAISFLGAGSFAQSYLLPHVKAHGTLQTVLTRTGINARSVADKFGFKIATTNPDELFADGKTTTVFIATHHDTHAEYATRAIKAGFNVFVEKPLALTPDQLTALTTAYAEKPVRLMVGFNRRFSQLSVLAKKEFTGAGEPLVMNFRVNAGFIPPEHWTQTDRGGGRILGEVCHFIDLMQFFTDSAPVRVYAECVGANNRKIKNDDNLLITLRFADGSIGNIAYFANGDKAMPKERLEISGAGKIVVIDDFKGGEVYKNNASEKLRASGKGHKEEVEAFLKAVKSGLPSPIDFQSMCLTTITTFRILDSLATGLPQEVHF
ncbi:MAG: bi-domain-containing oxidoreductase [Candidatus Ozemobacteraceae bacterium]